MVSSQVVLAASSTFEDDTNEDDPQKAILDINPIFSKVLGSIFIVLAIIALLVGHFDYMRCERALEDADKLVPQEIIDAEQGVQMTRMRWHNASSAIQAHSSR